MHWQLTLMYVGVTILITLIVELILVGMMLYLIAFDRNSVREAVLDIQKTASDTIPLWKDNPNRQAVIDYIVANDTVARNTKTNIGISFDVHLGDDILCVTDNKGIIISHLQPSVGVTLHNGTPLLPYLTSEEQQLFRRALANETNPDRLGKRNAQGAFIAAVPIRTKNNNTLNAIVFDRSNPISEILAALLRYIAPQLLLYTFFSSIIGMIVGMFVARRVTTRLAGISRATDAWSQGELTVLIPQSGTDELALLSGRLNRMAKELNDVIALRRDIATVQERHRLARDLHDTVKQQVFAAGLQIAAARARLTQTDSPALTPLGEAESLIRQAQAELTSLLRELRPLPGNEAHLPDRIQKEVSDWSRRTGIVGEFLASELFPLPEEQSIQIVRIIQEALANIARHSGATTARVYLNADRNTGEVTVSLSDNGRGFDRSKNIHRNGLGLSSMRERAEALPKGQFLLQSASGAGTRIEVRFQAILEQETK